MKKKFCSLILALSMILSFVPVISVTAATSGTCGDNLTWTLDDEGVLAINGTGDMSGDFFSAYETEIKTVIIGTGVTTIGGWAFQNCINLTSVSISSSVKYVGESAFQGCSSLVNINIPNSVKYIRNYSFAGCSNLKNISLPDGVISIGQYAFSRCGSLTSINIPYDITSIEKGTFYNCNQLLDVYYSGTSNEWNNIVIGERNEPLQNATIHFSSTIPTETPTPTIEPTATPTIEPTKEPTSTPTTEPTTTPTIEPTTEPTATPTIEPTTEPTATPTIEPTTKPTAIPTVEPTKEPTATPTTEPTATPTVKPTATPTAKPTTEPTLTPTIEPTPATKFTMLRDNFSFANTWSSFGYSSDYKIPLERYISVFGVTEGAYQYGIRREWGGSCYGFSATSSLFFENQLDYTQYSPNATSLFDLPAPRTPKASLTILLERYQISQFLTTVLSERSENWGKIEKIIRAVKHFENTGKDPIILCVFTGFSGHAVVPYKCVENLDGSHSIYVYDNNYPTNNERIVTINQDKQSFSYGQYKGRITFNYVSTVYNAMNNDISLFSVSEEQDGVATLTVNSNNVRITDVNGVSIENIKGAYEVIPVEPEIDTDKKTFIVPNGDYLVENNKTDIDELEISIANSKDYQQIKTDDIKAVVSIGVYATTGRVYAYISSSKTSNNSIKTLSSSGVSKLFESVGKNLGASAANSSSVEVVADSSVTVNGRTVSVGSMGDVGSASVSTDIEINASGDNEDFETVSNKNTLTYSNGSISGKLSYLIYNNTDALAEARVIVGLYSNDGKLVSILKNDNEVLALGSNYIDIGSLNYLGLTEQAYHVKCFVWDSIDGMQPLADVNRTDIQ